MSELFSDITNYFKNNIWNIILFFTILFIGIIIVKKLLNIIENLFNKTKIEKITQNFLIAFIKFGLYLIWFLILLSIIGIKINGIISALTAAFLAIGLALQNIIANVANGIIIISTQIFKKGDFIEINEVAGSVT